MRFFVSSTFVDMQDERDYIQNVVEKEIEKIAHQYHDEEVSFEDFRWGIDTKGLAEELHNQKVMKICLDEVVNCKPYLLVMMGANYGSLMRVDDIGQYKSSFEEGYFDSDGMVSLTELEILLGTDLLDNFEKTLFCFREDLLMLDQMPEEELDVRQHKLKNIYTKIKEKNPKYVFYYKDIKQFQEGIVLQIKKIFEKEYELPQYQSKSAKRIYDDAFRAKVLAKKNYGEELEINPEMEHAEALIAFAEENIIAITGDAGCGKSYVLNRLYQKFTSEEEYKADYDCMMYFSATENVYAETKNILECAVAFLEEKLSRQITEELPYIALYKEYFLKLLKEYKEKYKKQFFIFWDGMNGLEENLSYLLYSWLPIEAKRYVKVICTCTERQLPVYRAFHQIKVSNQLSETAIKERIAGYLNKLGKSMSKPVQEEIIKKCQGKNALFLAQVLLRFSMMNKNDYMVMNQEDVERETYFLDVINNLSDNEVICMDILNKANEYFQLEGLDKVLKYLALSKYGLREIDLSKLLEKHDIQWRTYEFALLRNLLSDFFVVYPSGKIDFAYKLFRKCIMELADKENNKNWKESYLQNLKEYIITLPVEEEIYRENIMDISCLLKDFKHCGRYIQYIAQEYTKISREKDHLAVQEANGGEWMFAILKILTAEREMLSNGLECILEECKTTSKTISEEEIIQTCGCIKDILDILMTNYPKEKGFKNCFTKLIAFCGQYDQQELQQIQLDCKICLAYLPALNEEYLDGAKKTKELLETCRQQYEKDISSKPAFNTYVLCKCRTAYAYLKYANEKGNTRNSAVQKNVQKAFQEARRLFAELEKEIMEFYNRTQNIEMLYKLPEVFNGRFVTEKIQGITKNLESYLEILEPHIDKRSAVSMQTWVDMQILCVESVLKRSSIGDSLRPENAGRLVRGNVKAVGLLRRMRENEAYVSDLLDCAEQGKAYRIAFRYYHTYFRAATLCIFELEPNVWEDVYRVLDILLLQMELYKDVHPKDLIKQAGFIITMFFEEMQKAFETNRFKYDERFERARIRWENIKE